LFEDRIIVSPNYPARANVAHGIPDFIEIADDYLSGFASRMKKFVVSNINAYMCWIFTAGGKENKIPLLQIVAIDLFALLKLLAGCSGQFNIKFGKYAFHKSGTVEAALL